jgi:hypothetical protein
MKAAGAGTAALALTNCMLEPDPDARVFPPPDPKAPVQLVEYGNYKDVYRQKWV